MAHNSGCICSECMIGKLGSQSVVTSAQRDVARYVAPDDDDDENDDLAVVGDPARDELAVRLSALELAGQRREAELRSAHVKLEAQERRIDELESSVRAISTTLAELGTTLKSTNAVLERLAALVPARG